MNKIFAVLTTLFVLCIFRAAWGMTWYVNGSVSASGNGQSWETAFKKIQEGIDAASDGHAVMVAQGTYAENIQFKGKNITLTSTDPLDLNVIGNTIIDGGEAGSVVTFAGTEDATCVLTGFTIQNGKAENGGGICGRKWGDPTHATVKYNVIAGNSADFGGGLSRCDGPVLNNVIISNSAAKYGGGLHTCHGAIRDNSIAGNTAEWDGGGLAFCGGNIQDNTIMMNSADSEGGGLYQCGGTVQNNKIKGNSAWRGGGLYWCDATIRNNTITDNSAVSNGGGLDTCDGIIHSNTISGNLAKSAAGLSSCNGAIQNNIITENTAEWRGGGVGYCDGAIRSNTIIGNSAEEGGGLYGCDGAIYNNAIVGNSAVFWGGGLMWCDDVILNNTIVDNLAGHSGGGLYNCNGTIHNCIIWANTASGDAQLHNSSEPAYSCIQDWDGGGEGNIWEEPRFVDPDGPDDDWETYEDNDYRLSSDSLCIDAGENSVLNPPGLDRDGNLRIAFGRDSLTVDMGAYEYNSRPFAVRQFGFVTKPWPGGRRLVWNSQPNDTYTVWSSYSLTGEWHEVGTIASQGETTSYTATGLLIWNWRTLFYQVEME